ncbi:MAG: acetyl-CoA carboxylase biotin carboxylase subunit [Pseudomonadales bacterium]
MIARLLIANRGAIARRIVRACDALGIHSVALYSEADADAPHLLEASSSVGLPGVSAADTYLNAPAIINAAQACGADGIHPGYGFLAEDADFAAAVTAAGLQFVGPSAASIRLMGDKLTARKTLAELGLPLFPGSGPLTDLDQAQGTAAQIGYPLLIKPAAGGGGIGMQKVEQAADFAAAFARASQLAGAIFGDDRLFLEQLITGARHIEFQLLGDVHGQVQHLYERECSVQRRHQKLIEESPAPGIASATLLELAERGESALAQIGYSNLGTLEMLLAPDGRFGVLEVNTRIQVEHAVTEMVTGVDLVQSQIRLAAGESLRSVLPQRPAPDGFAVEARIYAEDPVLQQASTGRLSRFELPNMTHVRVETGYSAGQSVTPYYDPLLAKIIAWGTTRELAMGRLGVALRAAQISGVKTNIATLQGVLASEPFVQGRFTTDTDTTMLNTVRA